STAVDTFTSSRPNGFRRTCLTRPGASRFPRGSASTSSKTRFPIATGVASRPQAAPFRARLIPARTPLLLLEWRERGRRRRHEGQRVDAMEPLAPLIRLFARGEIAHVQPETVAV